MYVYVFVGCCLATKTLNLNDTKWNDLVKQQMVRGV